MRTTLALAALLLSQAMVWPIALELVDANRCAIAGGSFDAGELRCDFGERHPGVAVWQRHGVALLLAGAFGVTGAVLLLRRKQG